MMTPNKPGSPLVPAKAGTQNHKHRFCFGLWIPAFAGRSGAWCKGGFETLMHITVSALVLVVATPAAAQLGITGYAPARLKSQVTVSSDVVRIGDLVENAGAAANAPIFRAPDLGQTGAVPVRAVLEAVRPHG